MILTGYRWIFVHVPRTGGCSVRDALRTVGGLRGGLRKHVTARDLRRLHPGFQLFGFVRNPWDRLVSLYAHLCQIELGQICDRRVTIDVGFKRWLMEAQRVRGANRAFWGDLPPPRQPQSWWLDGCDRIGRFEYFRADFNKIMRIAGIQCRLNLDCLNRSTHPHYGEMYDDEAREAVAEWHASDIARWGYQF